ncbi:putative quinol monooxygenase [Hyphomonas sp. NPDC076900]|uniref:putative quinol monooxygenase n=1 Tax=unclassified Hyphomonas TaxID=2630699 RepID=UPI003D081817
MPINVKVVAVLTAKPGKTEALRRLLEGMTAPSRAETGNLRYDLWQDQAAPDSFVLDELYKDEPAVAAHRDTLHFKNYVSRIGELAERTAVVLNPVDVA